MELVPAAIIVIQTLIEASSFESHLPPYSTADRRRNSHPKCSKNRASGSGLHNFNPPEAISHPLRQRYHCISAFPLPDHYHFLPKISIHDIYSLVRSFTNLDLLLHRVIYDNEDIMSVQAGAVSFFGDRKDLMEAN